MENLFATVKEKKTYQCVFNRSFRRKLKDLMADINTKVEERSGHLNRAFRKHLENYKLHGCSICQQLCKAEDLKSVATYEELSEMGTGKSV